VIAREHGGFAWFEVESTGFEDPLHVGAICGATVPS
jgi:hypothetical protein